MAVDMPAVSRVTYLRWTIRRPQYVMWDDFTPSVMVFDLLAALMKNNRQLLVMVHCI